MTSATEALTAYLDYLSSRGEAITRPLIWGFYLKEVPNDQLSLLQTELARYGYRVEGDASSLKAQMLRTHTRDSLTEAVSYFETLAKHHSCSFHGFTFAEPSHAI